MKTFLQEVAQDLYTQCGDTLHRYELLFPSRRAQLFFAEALSEVADRPIWQPQGCTIDQLMCRIAGLELGDRLRLLTELYKVYADYYKAHYGDCDTFDKFYTWGGVLLSDFDMVDKYRIDAEQLFRNIEDLKELESDLSYLTPRQLEVLRSFWGTLGEACDLTETKRKFLTLWRSLLPIYTTYRARLAELGFAYGGMVHRRAAERLDAGEFTFAEQHYFVVAGFNALSACERRLFSFLQANATTRFYWDYDRYYKNNPGQEAGAFIRQNLIDFPAACSVTTDAMQGQKSFTSVATTSNVIQCKYVGELLGRLQCEDKDTAVVLTDEKLLTPMLYALPEGMDVNVTMGFPLQQTPAYTLIERLLALQHNIRPKEGVCHFYHVDVTGLLNHPYILEYDASSSTTLQRKIVEDYLVVVPQENLMVNKLYETIFRSASTWSEQAAWLIEVLMVLMGEGERLGGEVLRTEYLRVIAEEIHKLTNSLNDCDIPLSVEIYASLVRRHLQSIRIPYKGEPLKGVQVMGILETRNLDFKKVILVSMTDDNFPGADHSQSSFIPPVLRQGFELPSVEHHESVYAYYFYRLIQRAEQVWMVYCARADEKSTGEPSRYIRQIDFESPFDLHKTQVGVDVRLDGVEPIVIEKTEEVMRVLNRYIDPDDNSMSLSPSSLMPYLSCPLQFYFNKVVKLRLSEDLEDEVDSRIFGNIFHAAAEIIYNQLLHVANPGKQLKQIINSPHLVEKAIDEAIAKEYHHAERSSLEEYSGDLLLVRNILIRYLKLVLAYDAANDGFYVEECEREFVYDFPFELNGQQRHLHFKGKVDRLDKLDSSQWRVLDYKTGKSKNNPTSIEQLFDEDLASKFRYGTQTMLYSMILYHQTGIDVRPALYYAGSMSQKDNNVYFGTSKGVAEESAYSAYAEEFEALLGAKVAELFDPAVPFRQCAKDDACLYCDFKPLCRRYPEKKY